MPQQAPPMQARQRRQLDNLRGPIHRQRSLQTRQLRILLHLPRRPAQSRSKLHRLRRLDRRTHNPHPEFHQRDQQRGLQTQRRSRRVDLPSSLSPAARRHGLARHGLRSRLRAVQERHRNANYHGFRRGTNLQPRQLSPPSDPAIGFSVSSLPYVHRDRSDQHPDVRVQLRQRGEGVVCLLLCRLPDSYFNRDTDSHAEQCERVLYPRPVEGAGAPEQQSEPRTHGYGAARDGTGLF